MSAGFDQDRLLPEEGTSEVEVEVGLVTVAAAQVREYPKELHHSGCTISTCVPLIETGQFVLYQISQTKEYIGYFYCHQKFELIVG